MRVSPCPLASRPALAGWRWERPACLLGGDGRQLESVSSGHLVDESVDCFNVSLICWSNKRSWMRWR